MNESLKRCRGAWECNKQNIDKGQSALQKIAWWVKCHKVTKTDWNSREKNVDRFSYETKLHKQQIEVQSLSLQRVALLCKIGWGSLFLLNGIIAFFSLNEYWQYSFTFRKNASSYRGEGREKGRLKDEWNSHAISISDTLSCQISCGKLAVPAEV